MRAHDHPHSAYHNMKLLGQHPLDGFGNCGEGMALQRTRDKRRVLWIAHESAPKNVTAVDVTNPKKPAVVAQTDLPHDKMRSNSLDLVGDLLVVAYQTRSAGMTPAGFELFDVSDPAKPRSVSFFDCSGPASRGVHHLWWVDGKYVHMSSGAADFVPRNPRDDQFYRIVDVQDPSKPREVGRWWLPGTREGDTEAAPPRHPRFDTGYRPHNTNVYPQRPDRAYLGYIDGGALILDIADMAHPRMLGRWDYHPPFPGFCHTVVPFFERGLLIVSDEAIRESAKDWPKLVWILDAHDERKLVSVADLPGARRSRSSASAAAESGPTTSTRTARGLDLRDDRHRHVLQRRRARLRRFGSLPASGGRLGRAAGAAQVALEGHPAQRRLRGRARILYTVDRMIGGVYIFEMDF